MAAKIASVDAMEILDSRGNPTVRAYVALDNGISAQASVPSGASTGEHEAVELRDGDRKRYGGKGVLDACKNIREKIGPKVIGMAANEQAKLDHAMIDIDGTSNKAKLGANAILGVSMAVARAASVDAGVPLYEYLGGAGARRIPVPCMNVINGGAHADNSVDFQEYMICAIGADTYREGLRSNVETFHTLGKILQGRKLATSVGDEGGYAPDLGSDEEALQLLVQAITEAGYEPGKDIGIAIDSASSSFSTDEDGIYDLKWSGQGRKTRAEVIDMMAGLVNEYPIVLWEDPLDENDWEGFVEFTARLGDKIEIVGDDIFVTNVEFIRRGIEEKAANACLIKLNQIGTVTETIDAVHMCQAAGWRYFLSHRSGETSDAFLADFAVAMHGGQLKTGSASRSERLAKYNRLLEIERELGGAAVYRWSKLP